MRLTNFLFIAAFALLASFEAVSAVTDSTQSKLSTMVFTDTVKAIEANHIGRRLLRTIEEVDDYDNEDDDGDLDSDDEERMFKASSFKLLAPEKDVVAAAAARAPNLLSRAERDIQIALGKISGGAKRIIGWIDEGKTAKAVKESLEKRKVPKDSDEWKSYKQYLAIELLARFPATK
ncbi:hypothetical protein PHYBOEH_006284 [Phytophthora boehmeriae]|uniref:RxLR effector protein n=1 Tax=Phytophthora boehmeriae TaxID=109152 RepID=A0A8T1WGE5_9STRA|nr:hypothetical protein PHYBOEH_006284 [Phytophthora boehmeriae]